MSEAKTKEQKTVSGIITEFEKTAIASGVYQGQRGVHVLKVSAEFDNDDKEKILWILLEDLKRLKNTPDKKDDDSLGQYFIKFSGAVIEKFNSEGAAWCTEEPVPVGEVNLLVVPGGDLTKISSLENNR